MNPVIIIPARYQSSRFPGKPLIDLCGKPMIVRVWERCIKVLDKDKVFVATDDQRIIECCKKYDINTLLTSSDCLTGTDRVHEAAKQLETDLIINVQGDEPLLDPQDVADVLKAAEENPGRVINAMCPINEEHDFYSANVPKVVCRPDGRLLYMSRAAIPTNKALKFVHALKQVCIYAFPPQALDDFAKQTKKTQLEQVEDIEILRFLELGYEVQMIKVSENSIAIDDPADVERVEQVLAKEIE